MVYDDFKFHAKTLVSKILDYSFVPIYKENDRKTFSVATTDSDWVAAISKYLGLHFRRLTSTSTILKTVL